MPSGLIGRWATGSFGNKSVTGEIVHITANEYPYIWILDQNGKLHAYSRESVQVHDRKPDENGPYR